MKRRLLALLALFTACADDDLVPKAGTWSYGGSDLVSNSCGGDPPTEPAGNFVIKLTGGGTFLVEDDDFDEAFKCSYEGDSFTCPNRDSNSYKVENIDATIHYAISVSGTFASETDVSGTQVVKVRCEGGSCELAADLAGFTLPCEYSYSFAGIAQ
jgi:hypothetical protein